MWLFVSLQMIVVQQRNDYFSCIANPWVMINVLIIIFQNQSPETFNQKKICGGTFVLLAAECFSLNILVTNIVKANLSKTGYPVLILIFTKN